MNNRLLLTQARKAIAFQIDQSPEVVTTSRMPLIDDGFGGKIEDPFGTPYEYKIRARISHQSSYGVAGLSEVPSGLDSEMNLWILWPHDSELRQDEIIVARGRKYKVGAVDKLMKFGGVQAYRAPVYPAGDL